MGASMKRLRWSAFGLAVVSLGLLTTPAAGDTKTVVRDKNLTATLTDCPVNAAVGTRCAAWTVFAAKVRVNSDGTIDKFGYVDLFKYRIKIVDGGFEAIFAADGTAAPTTFRVADDLSKGSLSGKVQVTFYENNCFNSGTCRTKWIPISLNLRATESANFQQGETVTKIDDCKIIERFNSQSRRAQGSAKVNGLAFVTSELEPFGSFIGKSESANITRGTCDFSPTIVPT
jgi:hypothetical protein